jgi:hypothetical protein
MMDLSAGARAKRAPGEAPPVYPRELFDLRRISMESKTALFFFSVCSVPALRTRCEKYFAVRLFHDFHDRAPTLLPLLHIAQIVSIRIRYNSPDIVLMGIEQPSWSSIESEILLLGAA